MPEAVHGDGRVQAWVVGPGLDPGDDAEPAEAQRDARARRRSRREPARASSTPAASTSSSRACARAPTLLTPHAGELARLLTRLERPARREVDRASGRSRPRPLARTPARLAELTGATVLLKGATTLVVAAGPAGPVRSQADAPAWLATAGAGDVLAGLSARCSPPGWRRWTPAASARWCTALAADRANPGGPVRAAGGRRTPYRRVAGRRCWPARRHRRPERLTAR